MSKLIFLSLRCFIAPFGPDFCEQKHHENSPPFRVSCFRGDPTSIDLEHLFDGMFILRDRFSELGVVIEDGHAYLPDLEERAV